MTFAREALPFVAVPLVVAIALAAWGRPAWAVAVAVIAAAVLLFFRVPARPEHPDPDAVLAPANGVVTAVDEVIEPSLGDRPVPRIVTFLSVFDVHVQRAPVSGRVVESRFRAGRKVAAFRKDAGDVNEHHWTVLETAAGRRYGIRQIAGLLARRVVSDAEVGARFERGDRIGLIKFGSRVDLYLPAGSTIEVAAGDRMTEGATVVARRLAATVPASAPAAGESTDSAASDSDPPAPDR